MNDIGRIAFIGGGNMATALISGLTQRGLAPAQIAVADPSAPQRERLQGAYGVQVADGNAGAAAGADVLILAVKPQMMRTMVKELAPALESAAPLVISVAAGITAAALSGWLGPRVTVIRAMPNRPALNGAGATALYAPVQVGAAERATAERIMSAVGVCVWVEVESQLDTVTAVSGSGPAYFFLFMEALQAAAEARGLPAEVARRLTLETAYGAALMARETHESLATLREQVTSKGGTTAAALAVLNGADLHAIVAQAVTAADERSAALAAEFGTP
jgi:pyrroline-5-carboxylate reductase